MIGINTEFPADIILYIDKLGFRDRPPEKYDFFQITCTVISQIREIFRLVLFRQKTV